MITKLINLLKQKIRNYETYYFTKRLRRKCKALDFTIISNSCLGGVVYHQLGKKFNSPTINLWIEMEGFFTLCRNITPYIDCEVQKIEKNCGYPMGIIEPNGLKPIIIHFNHSKTFEEAKQKWEERKKRIINSKIIIFFDASANENIDKTFVDNWNSITYPKICFGCLNRKDINDYYFVDFKGDIRPAKIMQYHKHGKLYLNQVDYCSILNKNFKDYDK